MRIVKSKATVYSFSGGRRYLSRAAALQGLAKQFLREYFVDDGGHCDDADMYAFAIRKLTAILRQAENEGADDIWIAQQWEAAYEDESIRLREERRIQQEADSEEESIL